MPEAETVGLRGINHVVLKVRSLERSDAFYRGVLGMERVGMRPGMWFYSAGRHHHDLALIELGELAEQPKQSAVGLFHLCFDVSDEVALAELFKKVQVAGGWVSQPVDHNVMHSFYATDPDGNVVEFGVDVPKSDWRDPHDPFARDEPYDLSNR